MDRCPTSAAGACSQRPMQGAGTTCTSVPSSAGSRASKSPAPASWQLSDWHTRTVSRGAAASSRSTSKWW